MSINHSNGSIRLENSEDVVIKQKIVSVTSSGRNEATFQSQMPEPLHVKAQQGVSLAKFLPDSYGYRPGRSALDAIGVTRERCWRYDWVLEFDIKGLFDNIDHALLLRALKKHVKCRWALLYIKRWLIAPLQLMDGTLVERTQGTPQGGLCKALHNPPYAKLMIMQSKSLKQADFQNFH